VSCQVSVRTLYFGVGGLQHSTVPQPTSSPAVAPSSKLAKIEPRQTGIAWLAANTPTAQTYIATVQKTQPSYLLLATSVGNSVVCQSPLKSPGNVDKIQITTGAAQIRKSQPSYLVLASSVGNSVGNSVGVCRQSRMNSPGGVGGTPSSSSVQLLSNSVVVLSSSSTSSSSAYCIAAAPPFLTVSGSGGSNLVLQTAGVQSTPGLVATLLLSAAPLDQITSKPSSAVQYVVPTPVIQPLSLQSPSNSMMMGNSQLNFVQSSLSNCTSVGSLQASPVRLTSSLGNSKLTVVSLSSSSCLPVGNSQTFVVQSPMGNSPSTVVHQSSSDCLLLGNSASPVIQPLQRNSQSNVAQQSSLYYVLVGNSQSSNVPVSLVNSTLPQMVLLGQTAGLTAAIPPQPQLLHSSSFVSATQ